MTRQPLAIAATIGGLVVAIGALVGVTITQDQVNLAVTAIATLAPLASAIVTLVGAHKHVTPVADPRDVDGVPLVRD